MEFASVNRRFLLLATALILALAPAPARAADAAPGEKIFLAKCASCHGKDGHGTKKYDRILGSNKSMPQLIRYIADSMPEDAPGSCSVPEAEQLAAYLFDRFYSKEARDRAQPPRVELSRLTVRQYRNAVADLVGSFRKPAPTVEKHGLRGEYFNARNFQADKKRINRIDPQVDFDFGTDAPEPETFTGQEVCILWQGAVISGDTGVYDFVVRSNQAVRLWINDQKKPLIDAGVKSGDDTEFRGSIYLLGDRLYPLRLEFVKAKQGVDDSAEKKAKAKPMPAFIELRWRPPDRTETAIPSRNLTPLGAPEIYSPTTALPPDDRSLGWERGTTISRAWHQATTEAALETANYIASHLNELAGTKDGATDRAAKAQELARQIVERAFRRPASEEIRSLYVDRQFRDIKDPEAALKRSVLLTLKSPRFLYRDAAHALDGFTVAERLSLALWDSMPDRPLLEAAAAGKLKDRSDVERQVERMLRDPLTLAKSRRFLLQWFKLDPAPDLTKAPGKFGGFDAALIDDLRTSLELSLDELLTSDAADFRQIFLGDQIFLNDRLAKFYGVEFPTDGQFQKVALESDRRAGLLTHPYVMSALAYTSASAPIHRGVFLARSVLGQRLKPPNEAFTPLSPDLHPTLTTRERTILQTGSTACLSCHGLINPLGFGLEAFDAVGRYRDQENGKPIDSSGSYLARSGETIKFSGARELAQFLANSPEVHDAFVEHLFHNLIQQPVRAFGAGRQDELRRYFADNGFNIRKLMGRIAAEAALAQLQPTSVPRESMP